MDSNTVLDSCLGKAVHPNNTDLDISAIDQFCLTLKRNPMLMQHGTQLLAKRIQSSSTKEAMFALEILNILLTWTNKYESCNKIQEAYNLLKTQGIEHHPQQNVVLKSTQKNDSRGNLDDSHFAKLRKLINSSKQEDRDKANLLIQNFYRDDERRTQMKARRLTELQKVAENTKLLDEMLSEYRSGESSEEELAIIRDIFHSCKEMHPTIIRLAEETQHSEGMLEKIFEVNDSLTQVLDKYHQVIPTNPPIGQGSYQKNTTSPSQQNTTASCQSQSSTSIETSSYIPNVIGPDPLDTLFDISNIPSSNDPIRSTFDDLSEIFSSPVTTDQGSINPGSSTSLTSAVNTETILTPMVITNATVANNDRLKLTTNGLNKYCDLKNLLQTNVNGNVNYHQRKSVASFADNRPVSTNTNPTTIDLSASTEKSIPDLDSLVSGMKSTLLYQNSMPAESEEVLTSDNVNSSEEDDIILDPVTPVAEASQPLYSVVEDSPIATSAKPQIKTLAEIVIDLDNIQPSREPSRTVWDDKDGLQITLNFAKDHPRTDVSVIVISTINQGRVEILDFNFDASVRKPCKLRLLPASGSSLPGTKPFRPPADGITQVLLLANPSGEPVDLTCILTYCVGNDPDPIKESIIMPKVPFIKQ
ncbi:ADP-ribosylation factor-binding protein GGA2 isoform X2 [Topomyia yanbarensis]|uniref:ADP-ribosylation factor-binding protein GGA2 isoform X2 n=1 Tax=Topomyia yanbarensis TaxID=2498891 RepID=UPI00273B5DA6|nr:ADP-ribosylation factor-binding protein GGA2 isoform X2 [Topomyia yanbarensis]